MVSLLGLFCTGENITYINSKPQPIIIIWVLLNESRYWQIFQMHYDVCLINFIIKIITIIIIIIF